MDDLRKLANFFRRVYGHIFIRPFQRYDVQNRAFKLLDKMETSKKPIVTAPKHMPTRAYLEQLIKEHPELLEKVNATPTEQLENLKKVRVRAEAVAAPENVKIETEESRHEARKLPSSRIKLPPHEMGMKDPPKVPVGKISLREAIDMVRGHALDPEMFNVKALADFHEMKEEDVYSILDRFKTYEVYTNDEAVASRRAPWYSKEKLQYFLTSGVAIHEYAIAEQEDERRKAWKAFLEERKKQRVDPELIEIAGLKAFPPPVKQQQEADSNNSADSQEAVKKLP